MKHKLDHVRALKEMLAQLPAIEIQVSELTTLEAVKLLQPEVASLQRKGYSFEMIAKVLGQNGFTVTASTLKKYRSAKRLGPAPRSGKSKATDALKPEASKRSTAPPAPASAPDQAVQNMAETKATGGFNPLEDTREI